MFTIQYVLISINCTSNSPVLNFGFNIQVLLQSVVVVH